MLRDNIEFNRTVKPNSAFLKELKHKLPEFFTAEKYDEDGNLVKESFFDIEKFKVALQEQNNQELSSGYQLDFIGKNYAKKQSGERPTTVIVPDSVHNSKYENSNSQNLFFTGDNLEVLRHLKQNYANSINVIYIDPPYNTGNGDFIYPDSFEYSDEVLMDMFGLSEESFQRLKSIQGKSTHSAWLTFMYPRLYLAKKLMADSGVIFASIDDNEQSNLKLIMDEVFGEGNFLGNVIWERAYSPVNLKKHFSESHDYILVYAKNINLTVCNGLPRSEEANDRYDNPDNDSRGVWTSGDLSVGPAVPENIYEIIVPSGRKILPPSGYSWRVSRDRFDELVADNRIWFGKDGDNTPRYKRFLLETKQTITPMTIWKHNEVGHSQSASQNLKQLFNDKAYFTYPKPVPLIKRLLQLYSKSDSVILDFFAGSSTTAHATIQLNSEDGGTRRFIMCTLPEPTYSIDSDGKERPTKGGKVAYEDGYRSIDEISRERICRAAAKIQEENPLLSDSQDFGFKHYRVVAPTQETMESIEYSNSMQLDLFDDMISKFSSESLGIDGQASGQDTILQTYLVKDGYKFDAKVEWLDIDGVKVPYIEGQRLYIISSSWETQNTRALINAIGTNQIRVQTIVVYGHSIEMARYRELEIALAQLEIRPNLQVRY